MATTKVVVDPVTRIEGHLRIEVAADQGRVQDAWAIATTFRGIELVLKDRDPRDAWAFAQRICGVCTTVHAIASIRAVEDALDIRIPPAANLIRNLVIAMQFVHDHVMHFYHLHALDWVDVVAALQADPAESARIASSISPWPNNGTAYFKDVQNRLKKFVGTGQLGIFANGYWGHPAYKLPPAVDLLAVAHYLEALDWQKDAARLHTIFGGKNPHPNFLVGGMASAINLDARQTINGRRIAELHDIIGKAQAFVEQVYWPDLLAIASFYPEWTRIGGGTTDFLCYGDLPDGDIRDTDSYYFRPGIVKARDLKQVWPFDPAKVQEQVDAAWYEPYAAGAGAGLHPYEGETKPHYTGPKAPWEYLQGLDKYTWMKAPRYEGKAMEVGPLARAVVNYAHGHPDYRDIVGEALNRLQVGPSALFSTAGRTLARGIETVLLARKLKVYMDKLVERIAQGDTATFTRDHWEPESWPAETKGFGRHEAPRGALGHWVRIKDRKIENYQAVVPSTWNCSPRDTTGQRGPYEMALMDNHPLLRPDQPLELIRTIHSFDPCLACGVHVLDATGRPVTEVKVQ
ncbi:MAG TPA: nickel-dependent hydrogenase large subunit [Gemmatimonadales bacterium]|nr:nickel-dependent hydrogenase large subunit [Gemmatimonadales bacterium]